MAVVINAVTGIIGNAMLDAGGAFTAVVSVPGAAVIGMSVDVSPETFPGEGVVWGGFVSGAGQVTVKVWRFTTGYVIGSVYNINVLTGSDAPAALELETNGTPNSSQTLLNLEAGTGVTLTDEGSGNIQIAASGDLTASGLKLPVSIKTANYTTVQTDFAIIANAAAGSFTVTLMANPALGTMQCVFKKDTSANEVTVNGNGNNICYLADFGGGCFSSVPLSIASQYDALILIWDGVDWNAIAFY